MDMGECSEVVFKIVGGVINHEVEISYALFGLPPLSRAIKYENTFNSGHAGHPGVSRRFRNLRGETGVVSGGQGMVCNSLLPIEWKRADYHGYMARCAAIQYSCDAERSDGDSYV